MRARHRQKLIDDVCQECRLTRPAGQTKHLFGIDRHGNGFFVASNRGSVVDRATYREMAAEARAAGVSRKFFVYCRICAYTGPGLEIFQIEKERRCLNGD